jgi:hypothetical protein
VICFCARRAAAMTIGRGTTRRWRESALAFRLRFRGLECSVAKNSGWQVSGWRELELENVLVEC